MSGNGAAIPEISDTAGPHVRHVTETASSGCHYGVSAPLKAGPRLVGRAMLTAPSACWLAAL